jgi:hypothetical protein
MGRHFPTHQAFNNDAGQIIDAISSYMVFLADIEFDSLRYR